MRILKLNSKEDYSYNNNNNICHLVIPPSADIVDMAKSYIQFEINRVYLTNNGYNFRELICDHPVALVRNCRLESDKRGVIEEVQNINILAYNLYHYNTDAEQRESDKSIYKLNGIGNNDWWHKSTNPSRYVSVRLPFSALFRDNGLKNLNTANLGNLMITLEFENRHNVFKEENSKWTAGTELACDNIGAAAQAYIDTTATDFSGVNPQVWTGMPVKITHNGGGNIDTLVTNVQLNAGGSLRISLVTNIPAGATTVRLIRRVGAFSPSLEIHRVNMVLTTFSKSEVEIDSPKTYLTWELEQFSEGATAQFNRQFNVPENCLNVVLLPVNNANQLVCGVNNINQYRWRIGEEDTTNRDVEVPFEQRHLYHDKLISTFAQMGEPLNDLQDSEIVDADGNGKEHIAIVEHMPEDMKPKQLHVNVRNAGGTAGVIGASTWHLFKQVEKVLQ